ncbi:collagen alpha-1(IX) chain-like isoform X2 [Salvelinus fontinalis]|uniref:collagen alpha-1(IX) chain-like isoform X2 n=1 Tax=Salvelinus fontinalis TaxID=8038 RepID=UPI0024866634|nr:collagen alpha-1(IX) chain-like isoform X2 [Salvelinus fontinalis]
MCSRAEWRPWPTSDKEPTQPTPSLTLHRLSGLPRQGLAHQRQATFHRQHPPQQHVLSLTDNLLEDKHFKELGEPGINGRPGMEGIEGRPGTRGDKGKKDKCGAPGLKGDQGPDGRPGPRGPRGEQVTQYNTIQLLWP